MTAVGFALIVATFVGLLTTWWQMPRWLNGVPCILVGLAQVQLLVDDYSANLLSVYIVVVGLFFVAVKRLVQPEQLAGKSRQGINLILAILGRGFGLLAGGALTWLESGIPLGQTPKCCRILPVR